MVVVLKTAISACGNLIELKTFDKNLKERKVLVIGVFHGDEPQGKYLIDEYLASTATAAETHNKSLLFIPCLNPDGMEKNTRTNSKGVDLNRNFPTKNWGRNEGENASCDDATTLYFGGVAPASEAETRFVIEVIEEYKPELILTLHAPYKVVNYDGPAERVAQEISKIIGYPAEGSIGYPTPGSFGTYCGVERNIPTITLELDEEIPVVQLKEPVFKIFDFVAEL